MFIKELEISNFKSFKGAIAPIQFNVPNGHAGSGLNIFVGENNTGKSTAFEAVDFVRNGTKKNVADLINKTNMGNAKVEITFTGDINAAIDGFSQPNKIDVFKKYVFQLGADSAFKISRDTEDAKAIKLWSAADGVYKNESGIDAPIKKLFETNFVWADTNPNDEASFGSTTICGNLLKEIANSFTETEDYQGFKNKFHEIFNNDASGLRVELAKIEQRVQAVFKEQFGAATISFHFDELKIDSFFKNTTIQVDNGVNTPMNEKGNGMQRAVALALLQVYAEELTKHPEDLNIHKPFYLFIDEPEICLHPKGQEKLLNALLEISKTKQVFLTTHSPYFLVTQSLKNIGLYIFSKNADSALVESASVNPLLPWSPTWGEINYKAYNLPTVEFHNELYGYLQEKSGCSRITEFELWLNGRGVLNTKQWTREENGTPKNPEDVTLHTFIRNKIHHPENVTMQAISIASNELNQSTQEMITLL